MGGYITRDRKCKRRYEAVSAAYDRRRTRRHPRQPVRRAAPDVEIAGACCSTRSAAVDEPSWAGSAGLAGVAELIRASIPGVDRPVGEQNVRSVSGGHPRVGGGRQGPLTGTPPVRDQRKESLYLAAPRRHQGTRSLQMKAKRDRGWIGAAGGAPPWWSGGRAGPAGRLETDPVQAEEPAAR